MSLSKLFASFNPSSRVRRLSMWKKMRLSWSVSSMPLLARLTNEASIKALCGTSLVHVCFKTILEQTICKCEFESKDSCSKSSSLGLQHCSIRVACTATGSGCRVAELYSCWLESIVCHIVDTTTTKLLLRTGAPDSSWWRLQKSKLLFLRG